jgi:hypothetical protein
MSPKRSKILGFLLIASLFLIGLLKDEITPDFRNTDAAFFLNPKHDAYQGVWVSFLNYPKFWFIALMYSGLFILIPASAVYLIYQNKIWAKWTAFLLLAIAGIQYGILLTESKFLIFHVIPKVNRYLHSPFILFFIIASLTLNIQSKKNG